MVNRYDAIFFHKGYILPVRPVQTVDIVAQGSDRDLADNTDITKVTNFINAGVARTTT